jgi:hypothetical protein
VKSGARPHENGTPHPLNVGRRQFWLPSGLAIGRRCFEGDTLPRAILRALDDLLAVGRIPADVHRRVRAAIWRGRLPPLDRSRRLQRRCRRSGDHYRYLLTSLPDPSAVYRMRIKGGHDPSRVDYFGSSRSCPDDGDKRRREAILLSLLRGSTRRVQNLECLQGEPELFLISNRMRFVYCLNTI